MNGVPIHSTPPRKNLEGTALFQRHHGIPRECLKFRLTFQRGTNKRPKTPSIQFPIDSVKRRQRVENFHGAKDADPQFFDTTMSDFNGATLIFRGATPLGGIKRKPGQSDTQGENKSHPERRTPHA